MTKSSLGRISRKKGIKRERIQCCFCSNTGNLTKQHLIAKRFHRYIADRYGNTRHLVINEEGTKFGKMNRSGSPRNQTARIVCRQCNEGWIKQVEAAASPIVDSINQGIWPEIREVDYKNIASYCVLCAQVIDVISGQICTTQDERNSFRVDRLEDLCSCASVKIGMFDGQRNLNGFWHTAAIAKFPHDDAKSFHYQPLFCVTMSIGKLLFQVISDSTVISMRQTDMAEHMKMALIWPTQKFPKIMPLLNDADFEMSNVTFKNSLIPEAQEA